jgi:hypothetical protein
MKKIGELHWRCHCGAEHMIITQHDNIEEQAKMLKDVIVGEITPRLPQDNITIDCKIITVKGRLLQANGKYLPADEADVIARKCGFQWAEQLVDFLTLRNPQ